MQASLIRSPAVVLQVSPSLQLRMFTVLAIAGAAPKAASSRSETFIVPAPHPRRNSWASFRRWVLGGDPIRSARYA